MLNFLVKCPEIKLYSNPVLDFLGIPYYFPLRAMLICMSPATYMCSLSLQCSPLVKGIETGGKGYLMLVSVCFTLINSDGALSLLSLYMPSFAEKSIQAFHPYFELYRFSIKLFMFLTFFVTNFPSNIWPLSIFKCTPCLSLVVFFVVQLLKKSHIYHIFFTHSIDGSPSCSHSLAIVGGAAM